MTTHALLDPRAVATRDSFTMLFFGSLLIGVGRRPYLGIVAAVAAGFVAVALSRLREVSDDEAYRRRLGVARTTAWLLVALNAAMAVLPSAMEEPAGLVQGLAALARIVHTFAVIATMSRLATLWGTDWLWRHWSRAFRLSLIALGLMVAALAGTIVQLSRRDPFAFRDPGPDFTIVFFFIGVAVAVAAAVQYLVAIWKMRTVAGRAAWVQTPAPDGAA